MTAHVGTVCRVIPLLEGDVKAPAMYSCLRADSKEKCRPMQHERGHA